MFDGKTLESIVRIRILIGFSVLIGMARVNQALHGTCVAMCVINSYIRMHA